MRNFNDRERRIRRSVICGNDDGQIVAEVRKYVPKIQDPQRGGVISVLAQRFADPALGELVLARDALGVDPQEPFDQ